MSPIVFPYILTLSVGLLVMGIYRVLASPGRGGARGGSFLIFAAVGVGGLGFAAFLPAYFAKPWMGYGLAVVALAGMVRKGV